MCEREVVSGSWRVVVGFHPVEGGVRVSYEGGSLGLVLFSTYGYEAVPVSGVQGERVFSTRDGAVRFLLDCAGVVPGE